jgi:hypothetical protein
MRPLFLAIGLFASVAALFTVAHGKNTSLDRLAARVERAAVIPEDTRAELRHLIDTAHYDARSNRDTAAIQRIERALRTKPTTVHH